MATNKTNKIPAISTFLRPGRKVWFLPTAAEFFSKRPCRTLIEPFAGTAVVGLSLLSAGIIERLVLVEKDEDVVCLLNGMFTDPTLANRFEAFRCTRENVEHVLATETSAFSLLVRSRSFYRAIWRGSIRNSIHTRWGANAVVPGLRRAYELRDRVTVIHGDAFDVLPLYGADPNIGCFCDSPYTAEPTPSITGLYRHHQLSHPKLFSILAGFQGPWLMSQNNCLTVQRLVRRYRLKAKPVRMKTYSNIFTHELMIYRNRPLF